MSKRVAIVQSNYIPWKGYFDLIRHSDEFVLFDEVQYTRRDWRNRNKIKTAQGVQWLTIPVKVTGRYTQKIEETEIENADWAERHFRTLCVHYSHARCFREAKDLVEDAYLGCRHALLSDINHRFLTTINHFLGIGTRLSWSRDYPRNSEDATGRLLEISAALGATEYLSGPAAKAYLDIERIERAGIKVTWMDYSGYPEYPQLNPPFEHAVSIIDLIFNTGRDAASYLKPGI